MRGLTGLTGQNFKKKQQTKKQPKIKTQPNTAWLPHISQRNINKQFLLITQP